MKAVRARRIGLILFGVLLVLALAAITTGGLAPQNQLSNNTGQKIALSRPPFMLSARADVPQEIAAMLDQEAGISAWLEASGPINLTNVIPEFLVIEDQTSDYIVGSVDLFNYPEIFDVHAFVHVDGWIMAYYLRQDPASKIVSIKEKNISSTNLDSIIGILAGAAGVPSIGINYYDFRYPNAENILLVYEDNISENYFFINMPSSFVYSERSFSIYNDGNCCQDMWLDGVRLTELYQTSGLGYGAISAAQMPAGVEHEVEVDEFGVLAITYTEP